ncbi:MAG: VOC family protein [Dehalococcoidia bacterium]
MLNIYRVDHIGQVVSDLEPQLKLLEGLFGFQRRLSWTNPEAGCCGVRLDVPGSWGHRWEVLAPMGEGSPLQAFMERQDGRPGLHHVAVEVPLLEAAVAELRRRHIQPTVEVPGLWIEASLSPPEHGPGVLFRIKGNGAHATCGDEPGVATAERPSRPGGKTLGIVAIDHVCQAFPNRDELAQWYRELAGFVQVWRTPADEHPDMADLVMNVPGSTICWEVIMPRGADSFIERFLSRSGPAAHHVTFEVADWDRAMDACRAHEIPTFGDNSGTTDGARWQDVFIHPRYTGGILVQLFWEERPGVWVRSDKIAPEL